jgi:hypothetical protein
MLAKMLVHHGQGLEVMPGLEAGTAHTQVTLQRSE